ncbi:MAG: hypothetical protein B6A08_05850 [Sorangiineae bacterium NIC37A_2]|jgi:biopolymer transport protein TolR|nr:MAG: hypothetical protein B6A08_05850 [Sorangiineae bacterium NIC37A_2]
MGRSPLSGPKKLPEPEMNVTPLVDVVLVLLIIFMVITPALSEGEPIELPAFAMPDPKPKDLHPIDVVLAPSGRVLVEERPIDPGELEAEVRRLHTAEPERTLLLKADARLDYGKVRDTFARLQTVGFKGVSLKVTERKGKNP